MARRRKKREQAEPEARSPEVAGRQVYPPAPPDAGPEPVLELTVAAPAQGLEPQAQPGPVAQQSPVSPPGPGPALPQASGAATGGRPPDAAPLPPPPVEPTAPAQPPTAGGTGEPPVPGEGLEAGTALPPGVPTPQVAPLGLPPEYAMPMMYQPPMMYPGFMVPGYMLGYPAPGETGQMPAMPPLAAMPPAGAMPQVGAPPPGIVPPGSPAVGAPAPLPMPPPLSPVLQPGLEDSDFEMLANPEPAHWRDDFKWVFGFLTALFVLLALTAAGMYRATGPGPAGDILRGLVKDATRVVENVEENYQELLSKARRSPDSNIAIPDIGIEVSLSAEEIDAASSSEELAEQVVIEVQRKLYDSGYGADIPMKDARGVGEERARAADATLLTVMNRETHSTTLWLTILFGGIALVLGIPFMFFCRGWGKLTGAGLALIAGSLPGSLLVRIANEFVFRSSAGTPYRAAMSQALHTTGSAMLLFYDIALGAGALILLGGVVASVVARRTRRRVPPFTELSRPEELVVEDVMLEAGPGSDIFDSTGGTDLEPGRYRDGGGTERETTGFEA